MGIDLAVALGILVLALGVWDRLPFRFFCFFLLFNIISFSFNVFISWFDGVVWEINFRIGAMHKPFSFLSCFVLLLRYHHIIFPFSAWKLL